MVYEIENFNKTKILIADDSDTDRLLLKTILRNQGHNVVDAADGLLAVELFERERPGIVLLDALMPNMDGFETARQIKAMTGDELVPVIFLTSLQEADSLVRCLEAGGDDFLSKPYNPVILEAKINAFIRMREMHQMVLEQRDQISGHNEHLLQQQNIAKRIFDRVAHSGCLDAPNIQYTLSPKAVFDGDVMLAGVNPAGNLTVFLGDFTGHGLHAAVGAMPLAQTFYSMVEKGFSLRETIREINTKLFEILPVDVFCCAFIAEIDFAKSRIQTWNCGLPDCVIHEFETGSLSLIKSRNIPLGISAIVHFDETVEFRDFLPGDRLYVWSDGIHEAQNIEGELFGEQRLHAIFEKDCTEGDFFSNINNAVSTFVGSGPARDDISLLEVTMVDAKDFDQSKFGHWGKYMDQKYKDGEKAYELGGVPNDWSLSYEMRENTLRDFDPLPLMSYVLMQVPYLHSIGGKIFSVLSELYTNALEHGVLGLSSALKNRPGGFDEYYRQRAVGLDSLQSGSVVIELHYKGTSAGGCLSIVVSDSGAGFDYRKLLKQEVSDRKMAGRGVHLVESLCSSIEYRGRGNEVNAVLVWGDNIGNTLLEASAK